VVDALAGRPSRGVRVCWGFYRTQDGTESIARIFQGHVYNRTMTGNVPFFRLIPTNRAGFHRPVGIRYSFLGGAELRCPDSRLLSGGNEMQRAPRAANSFVWLAAGAVAPFFRGVREPQSACQDCQVPSI
jgi:hypothetical protein